MDKIFSAKTETARAELDLRDAGQRVQSIMLAHHMLGAAGAAPATGGYVSLKWRETTEKLAYERANAKTGKAITTAVRLTNVVTVVCTGHGARAGDLVVLRDVNGTTSFNSTPAHDGDSSSGGFVVLTTADADTLTYAQAGDDDATGKDGFLSVVRQASVSLQGKNIKTAATATNYVSHLTGLAPGVYEATLTVTDGTHTVWVGAVPESATVGDVQIPDGYDVALGATTDSPAADADPSATAVTAMSLWKRVGSWIRAIRLVSGVIDGAAVVTDATGTLQGYLRGLVKMVADCWDSTVNCLRVRQKTLVNQVLLAAGTVVNANGITYGTGGATGIDNLDCYDALTFIYSGQRTIAGAGYVDIFIQGQPDGATWMDLYVLTLNSVGPTGTPLIAPKQIVPNATSADPMVALTDGTHGASGQQGTWWGKKMRVKVIASGLAEGESATVGIIGSFRKM